MALQLDDFLGKKKEAVQVLDLSRSKVKSKEEFDRLLEKVPEYKIRPEKVRPEEMRIRDKDFSFKPTRKERKQDYSYADPMPPTMRSIRLEDFSAVDIPWKMLTTLRPKTKLEEELFSRFIDMGKLRLRTTRRERRTGSPSVKVMKTRAGVWETRSKMCPECLEEFCNTTACRDFGYDAYLRVTVEKPIKPTNEGNAGEKKGKKKKKKKGKKKKKSKSKQEEETET